MREVFSRGMEDYEATRPVGKIKEQAARFSWKHTAETYIDLYKQVSS
jgi:hypothetical protein